MSDAVHQLYQQLTYPPMSHPRTDPAITAVAASLAGLQAPDPAQSNILEIGCARGHNLLPLAARWPRSTFTGIDFSTSAIREATQIAASAGLRNIRFVEADLRNFAPGDGVSYDFIICHGIYSWVPDTVRQALMNLCAAKLSSQGIAVISFNVLPGWSLRKSIVSLARSLSETRHSGFSHADVEEVLTQLILSTGGRTTYQKHLNQVLHDMLGQGAGQLAFDDFSPVNEPCTFLDFHTHAAKSGLQYLGEALPGDNRPATVPVEASSLLDALGSTSLLCQQAIDVLTNRTFRHAVLCRKDVGICHSPAAEVVLGFSARCPHGVTVTPNGVRLGDPANGNETEVRNPLAVALIRILAKTPLESIPLAEVIPQMADLLGTVVNTSLDIASLAQVATDAASQRLISLRYEPVRFDPKPPEMPTLDSLRLTLAKHGQPLVDAYHVTHPLDDDRKRHLATMMDGSRSQQDLADIAQSLGMDVNVHTWISRLAARGMFMPQPSRE